MGKKSELKNLFCTSLMHDENRTIIADLLAMPKSGSQTFEGGIISSRIPP